MIPVVIPPAIYRLRVISLEPLLDLMPAEVGLYATDRSSLEYKVDIHNDFLRTNDFTPQQAFGRSFAYRQALAAHSSLLQSL